MAKSAQRGRRKGQISRKANTVLTGAFVGTRSATDGAIDLTIPFNDAHGNRMSSILTVRVVKSGKNAGTLVSEASAPELVSAAPEIEAADEPVAAE